MANVPGDPAAPQAGDPDEPNAVGGWRRWLHRWGVQTLLAAGAVAEITTAVWTLTHGGG